jgi:hypothetical protein
MLVMLVYVLDNTVKWGELLVDFPFDPSYTGAALVSHLSTCMHTSATADIATTAKMQTAYCMQQLVRKDLGSSKLPLVLRAWNSETNV